MAEVNEKQWHIRYEEEDENKSECVCVVERLMEKIL